MAKTVSNKDRNFTMGSLQKFKPLARRAQLLPSSKRCI
jgi:hypothetical protein